ncbi:hypothetical protein COCNU_06G002910 [Cocos nucifera]|uniref:DUF4283 domain-containing protein n=1 Tax=Cocos nucifera TaxID=13894 RepID=A0A8K0N2V5_COCNU|nr:hypothetical protein COCNU_06G002910 [Cocos nucifera]
MWADGVMVFSFPDEATRERVMEKGPWSSARQLLALEPWRSNFRSGKKAFQKVKIKFRLLNLPLELLAKKSIWKIASRAGKPLFLDEWTISSARLGLLEFVLNWISANSCVQVLKFV